MRIRKQAFVRQCCCCCNHHNKQAKKIFSFLRSVLPSESLGKSVDSWVGPAGLKGLTVCDSLQQMVVVGGVCTHTDTFEAPSLQFQRWQKITILSSPFQGYFWLGLFSDGKRFQPPPNSTPALVQKRNWCL